MTRLLKCSSISKYIVRNCLLLLLMTITFLTGLVAQIDNNGCVADNFGIDADLYSGMVQFGDGMPALGSDDWFLGSSGRAIIDQSNSAAIQALLGGATPTNKLYEARMNGDIFSVYDGRLWVDAVYARDYFGGTGFVDTTAYTIASKNGQDPASWGTGPANVLGKNDLIDVAGFMRRSVPSMTYPVPPAINLLRGDLWFYGLIIRAEPGGDAYMDFEFYVADVTYSKTTQKFTSGGPDMGHTAFQFGSTGKITKLGDVIFNTSLTGGGTVPNVEIRIWMSKTNFDAFRASPPANLPFVLQAEFDGAINGAPYGYARITPKFTEQACGRVNQASQLPNVAPWGHRGTKSNIYIPAGGTHQVFAVSEVAMNMSLYGIDNSLLDGADLCAFPYHTFIVKSRSSAAFAAQLKDFGGPYSWAEPRAYAAAGGLLSCLNPTTTISATPARTDVVYSWTTVNGTIVGPSNTATITVSKPGTYTLNYILPTGCPATPVNVVVGYDATKPFFTGAVATGNVACTPTSGMMDLTVTGATPPYTYLWSPGGAVTQDLSGVAAGTYSVTVTDANTCTRTTSGVISAATPLSITPTPTNVACNGGKTGAISLAVTGKFPFTYKWSNGNLTKDITNLTAGTYTVTVTDADGCTATSGSTITQPNALSLSAIGTNDTDPSLTTDNGTLDLTVTGGTASYTYSWIGPNGFTYNMEDPTGLERGTYSVTVTDANLCTSTLSYAIWEPEICNDGIDNDNDGLTDCDDPDCKPLAPTGLNNPPVCVSTTVAYTVTHTVATEFQWTLPAGATITTTPISPGIYPASINVIWNNTQGGNVCVRAKINGCLSDPICVTVVCTAVPTTPTNLTVD